MLKCILVDDEIQAIGYLKSLCEKHPEIEIIKAFQDPRKFLTTYRELDFDVVFLDIEMPGMLGTEVARKIENKGIIFTTAYKHFAVDAFELNAVDYLTKPLNEERLRLAIEKAFFWKKHQEKAQVWIDLPTSQGKSHLLTEEIFSIKTSEIDKRDKILFFNNGEEILIKNTSFTLLNELLPAEKFCQINRGEIINLKRVKTFSDFKVHLSNSSGQIEEFVIGDKFKINFLNKMRV